MLPSGRGNGHCLESEIATDQVREKGNDRNGKHSRRDDGGGRHAPLRGRIDQPPGAPEVAGGIGRERDYMSAEADQLCASTGNSRNGCRERKLVTCV